MATSTMAKNGLEDFRQSHQDFIAAASQETGGYAHRQADH